MRISHGLFDSVTRGAITAALLALGCAATPLAAQQVYRSVDSQGHVTYADRGATKEAPKTTLHIEQPDPAEVARLAHEQQLLDADEATRARQQALEDRNKATQQRKQQQACERARSNYYQMKDVARIYERDAQGNRAYLSDADADATREQARRTMVAACGS
jgi:hypothetical protein